MVYTGDLKSPARMGLRVRVPHQLPFQKGEKMSTLFKFIVIPAFRFGSLDWAADNPAKVKVLRNQVVKQFKEGKDAAIKEMNEMAE